MQADIAVTCPDCKANAWRRPLAVIRGVPCGVWCSQCGYGTSLSDIKRHAESLEDIADLYKRINEEESPC